VITTLEMSKLTGLPKHQIWYLVKIGKLTPVKLGKMFVWDETQVTEALAIAKSKTMLAPEQQEDPDANS